MIAACISLTHAFQNRRITSTLHPADAQVQEAHRPPGMGYGAIDLAIVHSFHLRALWRIQRPIVFSVGTDPRVGPRNNEMGALPR